MAKTCIVFVLSVTCLAAFAQYSDCRPVRAKLCFDYFTPILRDVALEFSRSYQECAVAEGSHIDGIQRRNSTQDSKIIITALASQDFELERCQNLSQRAFVENTARGYYNLRICLKPADIMDTTPVDTTPTTETTTVSSSEEDDSSSTQETTGGVNATETTIVSSSEEDDWSRTQETTGAINITGTTTPPSNSVPDGSDSVSKIELSGLLLLLNIWIVYFQSRNS